MDSECIGISNVTESRRASSLPTDWELLLGTALRAVRSVAPLQREKFRSTNLRTSLKSDSTPVTEVDIRSEELIRAVLQEETPGLGILGEEFGAEGSALDRWIVDPIDGTENYLAGIPYYATLIALMLDGEVVMGVVHAPSLGPGSERPLSTVAEVDRGRTWWAVRGHGAYAGTGTRRKSVQGYRLRTSDTGHLNEAIIGHGGLELFRKHRWDPFVNVADRGARLRGFGDWWGHMLVAEGRCDAMIDPVVALHDLAAIKPIVEEAGGVFRTPRGLPLDGTFRSSSLSSNGYLADELTDVLEFDRT